MLDDYDYVLIDCPPSLGLLTVNGLAAAREVLVPIQCEYYALEGLGQLLRNVDLVKRNLNPGLEVSTIVCVMYDARTKLSDQVVSEVREHFGDKVLQVGDPPIGPVVRGTVVRAADHHVRSHLAGRGRLSRRRTRRCTMARLSGLGKGLSSLIPTAERPDGDDACSRRRCWRTLPSPRSPRTRISPACTSTRRA